MSDVDPTLLALSDLLVLTALERTWARQRRSNRPSCPPTQRHMQYMRYPVPDDRIEHVLRDAWCLCPQLVTRHHLDVDADRWADVLNDYTRALLLMTVGHTPDRLTPLLLPLAASAPDLTDWNSDDVWGAASG
jgi:hypothetical protein